MNIFYGTREYAFEMSHALFYLNDEDRTDSIGVYGRDMAPHGHNFKLKVTIKGSRDPKSQMIRDLSELDHIYQRDIDSRFDHRHFDINNLAVVPTLENLTKIMWDTLYYEIKELQQIQLYEEPELFTTYTGEKDMYVTATHRFNAQHKTENPKLSGPANESTYGKCNRYHGHSYTLETTIKGPVNEITGYIVNPIKFNGAMNKFVAADLEHQVLNEFPDLKNGNATTENLLEAIWLRLEHYLEQRGFINKNQPKLYSLKLVETSRNSFTYFGPSVEYMV